MPGDCSKTHCKCCAPTREEIIENLKNECNLMKESYLFIHCPIVDRLHQLEDIVIIDAGENEHKTWVYLARCKHFCEPDTEDYLNCRIMDFNKTE